MSVIFLNLPFFSFVIVSSLGVVTVVVRLFTPNPETTRAGIWGLVGIPQRLIVHVVYISYKSPKNGGAGNTGGGN